MDSMEASDTHKETAMANVTLTLSTPDAERLAEILDQSFATSVNHLVSSTLAKPGEWHALAPKLAAQVETDRMLKLTLSRARGLES
jgi:hypothetical protein